MSHCYLIRTDNGLFYSGDTYIASDSFTALRKHAEAFMFESFADSMKPALEELVGVPMQKLTQQEDIRHERRPVGTMGGGDLTDQMNVSLYAQLDKELNTQVTDNPQYTRTVTVFEPSTFPLKFTLFITAVPVFVGTLLMVCLVMPVLALRALIKGIKWRPSENVVVGAVSISIMGAAAFAIYVGAGSIQQKRTRLNACYLQCTYETEIKLCRTRCDLKAP